MFFNLSKKNTKVSSTAFSDFVNKSSSREKKRVFSNAIKQSTESQNKMIKQACNSL